MLLGIGVQAGTDRRDRELDRSLDLAVRSTASGTVSLRGDPPSQVRGGSNSRSREPAALVSSESADR
jgi:hypothetical protein